MLEIASRAHPIVKQFVRLQQSARFRRQSGLTVLDGVHLIQCCLDAGLIPQNLIVSASGLKNNEVSALLQRCSAHPHTRIVRVTDTVFIKLSPLQSPTGILAGIAMPQTHPQHGPFSQPCCVLLEAIQDPGNLGTILRSAAGAGATHVYLSPDCCDAWSPKTLRAAMGAHFLLTVHTGCDLAALARHFRGQVVGTAPNAAKSIYQCDFTLPTAFVFGNEGAGLSPAMQQAVTTVAAIPMPGKIESLNAGAAATLCMFEWVRHNLPARS